jgi:hypothetical protein
VSRGTAWWCSGAGKSDGHGCGEGVIGGRVVQQGPGGYCASAGTLQKRGGCGRAVAARGTEQQEGGGEACSGHLSALCKRGRVEVWLSWAEGWRRRRRVQGP